MRKAHAALGRPASARPGREAARPLMKYSRLVTHPSAAAVGCGFDQADD
jgi:hypothetical protein